MRYRQWHSKDTRTQDWFMLLAGEETDEDPLWILTGVEDIYDTADPTSLALKDISLSPLAPAGSLIMVSQVNFTTFQLLSLVGFEARKYLRDLLHDPPADETATATSSAISFRVPEDSGHSDCHAKIQNVSDKNIAAEDREHNRYIPSGGGAWSDRSTSLNECRYDSANSFGWY